MRKEPERWVKIANEEFQSARYLLEKSQFRMIFYDVYKPSKEKNQIFISNAITPRSVCRASMYEIVFQFE